MAKLPRYIKLKPCPGRVNALTYTMTIKRWGVPFLVFKVLKERFNLKWYHWLWYPFLCFIVALKWGRNNG